MEANSFTLPPQLVGGIRGHLTLWMSHFRPCVSQNAVPNAEINKQTEIVRILWWGYETHHEVRVDKNKDFGSISYDIVTTPKSFQSYLKDSRKLYMEITDHCFERIGFSLLSNLEKVMDHSDVKKETLEVFNANGELLGEIDCFISVKFSSEEQSYSQAFPKQVESEKKKRPLYRPPNKRFISPARNLKNQNDKVLHEKQKSVIKKPDVNGQQKSTLKSAVKFADEPIVSNSNELEKVILRSKKQINRSQVPYSSDDDDDDDNANIKVTRVPTVNLPSWNLSNSRLRFISSVTTVIIEIKSIVLKDAVLRKLHEEAKKSHVILRNKELSSQKKPASSIPKEPLSFFVSFTMPPATISTNFCSRKLTGLNKIDFNQKCSQPITFKPDLLDKWWTSEFVVKVLSRTMKQRLSTLIGEASIGLKYLLTNPQNSNGTTLKLPIYSASTFSQTHQLTSEIVGDIFITFTLQKGSLGPFSLVGRPVSPQKPVRDGEMDESSNETTSMCTSGDIPKKGKSQRTISSASSSQDHAYDTPCSVASTQLKTNFIYCLLKVTEGRNFTLRSDTQNNLFLSCRFMTSKDTISSEVAWNTTRPKFNLMHYVPLLLDEDFLKRCKDNFLVIEVWSLRDEKEIIGVVMVPLHQFYLSFRNKERTKIALSSKHPVIATNDWMSVKDLLYGKEQGEIKVTLAAGSDEQVRSFEPQLRPSMETDREWSEKDDNSSNGYDSVYSSSTNEDISDSNDAEKTRSKESNIKETISKIFGSKGRQKEARNVVQEREKPVESSKVKATQTKAPCVKAFSEAADKAHQKLMSRTREDSSVAQTTQTSEKAFDAIVCIEEARNLPNVFSSTHDKKVVPSAFVTFHSSGLNLMSKIIPSNGNPHWEFKNQCSLDFRYLLTSKNYFVVKVWHHDSDSNKPDLEKDYVIGFVAIDLRPLLSGFPTISGWYNIMDYVGRCRGQMKVTVRPTETINVPSLPIRRYSEALSDYNNDGTFAVIAKYKDFPSHIVQHTEQIITTPEVPKSPERGKNESFNSPPRKQFQNGKSSPCWSPPKVDTLPPDLCTASFLHSKLKCLGDTTEKLKNLLSSPRKESVRFAMEPEQESPQVNEDFMSSNVHQTTIGSLEKLTADMKAKLDLLKSSEEHLVLSETSEDEDFSQNTNVSREIIQIFDDDPAESPVVPPLIGIQDSTLEDLGSIDWSAVLDGGNRSPESRMRPEGGSPRDESVSAPKKSD